MKSAGFGREILKVQDGQLFAIYYNPISLIPFRFQRVPNYG